MKRFSDVIEVDRNKIVVDPSRFQGRLSDYSQDTVNAIVAKGKYDKSGEPIIVWEDPAIGKYIVISGHSRFEATRRLFEAGQTDLKTIPVKTFLGSQDDAIDYAVLESNRGSTEEGLISDLQAYRRAVSQGRNKTFLQSIFKPESRLKKLQNLYFLNPKGKFIEYLAGESAQSFPYIERNAQWVGQIRSQLPAISDSHENEMFDYIYKDGKGLKLDKAKFFDLIDKKVNRIDFDPEKALNLNDRVSANVYTDPINEQIAEIDKEIDKWGKEIESKRELIIRAKKEGKDDFIPKFQERITELNAAILRKIEEREKLRSQAGKLERTIENDLFSMEAEPEPQPVKVEEKNKISYSDYYSNLVEIVKEKQEINNSDAQGIVDARENEVKEAWNNGNPNKTEIDLYDILFKEEVKPKIKPVKVKKEPVIAAEKPKEERTKEEIKADLDKTVEAAEKEITPSLTQAEVIAIGLKINSQRNLYSQFVDNSADHKKRLSPTPENLLRWMKNPGKFDLIGVDTFKRDDQTGDYKRLINKQKIFNLYGIKI